jgi:[ribosomal protein S5]-alanine N-acetyltransferase
MSLHIIRWTGEMLVTETPRLLVRHFSANDADAMKAIFCDPEVMRYSDDGVQTPEFARVWVANMIGYYPMSGLQRFPFIWDRQVIPYERETLQIPLSAPVLVGEPDSTSPGHALGMWAVIEKVTQDLIGYVGLSRFPSRCGPNEAELGFRLARRYWGRGYATEAAGAACDYALHRLLLPRIIAMIDPDNTASVRVAVKIGMTRESEIMFQGYTHPDHLYAIRR